MISRSGCVHVRFTVALLTSGALRIALDVVAAPAGDEAGDGGIIDVAQVGIVANPCAQPCQHGQERIVVPVMLTYLVKPAV